MSALKGENSIHFWPQKIIKNRAKHSFSYIANMANVHSDTQLVNNIMMCGEEEFNDKTGIKRGGYLKSLCRLDNPQGLI